MGNILGVVDKDSFPLEEISPFNCHERGSIDLCYERICTSFDASVTMTCALNDPELSALHPNLLKLLKQKGILLSRETFTTFLCDSLRVNSNRTVDIFWKLLLNEDEDITESGHLLRFFSFMLSLTNSVVTASEKSSCTVNNLTAQLLVDAVIRQNSDEKSMSLSVAADSSHELLKRWIRVYGPCVPKIFESYLTEKCLGIDKYLSFSPFLPPSLNVKSDILVNGAADLIPLSLYSDLLQGSWSRLYSSSCDGLSFNRMIFHIIGYEGPLCILIKPQGFSNAVFGAFSTGRWKESNSFYGSSDTFLFTIKPEFKIMRSRDRSNSNYQWLNTKSYSLPHGLALGGTLENFRLFISESFDNCTANENCLTYESGNLLPVNRDINLPNNFMEANDIQNGKFEIDAIEIWATGGAKFVEHGLKELSKTREIKEENIQRARKVDKAQFFNNAFDKEFLLSGTFQHASQVADHHDCSTVSK